ncbi:MAG: hypothetical protein IJF08_03295, partial [Clostridia bacterium]|nr:hypothetical protein [Clostridia bacterium]
ALHKQIFSQCNKFHVPARDVEGAVPCDRCFFARKASTEIAHQTIPVRKLRLFLSPMVLLFFWVNCKFFSLGVEIVQHACKALEKTWKNML